MNAKELADSLVEAGIGEQEKYPLSCDGVGFYYTPDDESEGMCADLFITDWRVVGACLKAWPTTINTEQLDMTLDEMLRDPAAICEAFTQALEARQ